MGRPNKGGLPHFSQSLLIVIGFILILMSPIISPQPRASPRLVQNTMPTYSASIVDYAFRPLHINITTGTQIIWTYANNGSTIHTVTSSPQTNTTQGSTPLLNSGSLNPGKSFTYTFNKHGFYPFQCAVHPTISAMNGWVNVTGTDIVPSTQQAPVEIPLYAVIGGILGVIAITSAAIYFFKVKTRKPRESSSP